MMRVLFIRSNYRKTMRNDGFNFQIPRMGLFPPLGLFYIATYLREKREKEKYEVTVLDLLTNNWGFSRLKAYIKRLSPAVVGISTYYFNLIDAVRVAQAVKEIDKRVHVCAGGDLTKVFPMGMISLPWIDSVIPAEGEITFTELADCLNNQLPLNRVKGLIFKQSGEIIINEHRPQIEDLDSLPFPDRRLTDYRKYYFLFGHNRIMTNIEASRGCPYKCKFCCNAGTPYRIRSVKNVVDELEMCVDSLGIREFVFSDENLNVFPSTLTGISEEILRRDLKIRWAFRARVDNINEEVLRLARRSGAFHIGFGVETGSEEGLKLLNKGFNLGQVGKGFKWCRELGISTAGFFMLGCQHEKKKEDILETIEYAIRLNPNFAFFFIFRCIPTAQIYEEEFKRKTCRDKESIWRDYLPNFYGKPGSSLWNDLIWQGHFSREQLFALQKMAYRKFYLRPSFVLGNLGNWLNLRIPQKLLKTY